MPDLSANEMSSGQPVSAAVNPHRQPISDPTIDGQTAGEFSTLSDEQCSTSKPSSNELTNSLKRPLLNKSMENDEIKKIKLIENNHNQEQLSDAILNDTNHNNEDVADVLLENNDRLVWPVKSKDENISQVSNNISCEKRQEESKNDTTLDSVSNTSCLNHIVESPNREIICEESYEPEPAEPSNMSTILNKCVPVLSQVSQSSETIIINCDNDVVENGNSSLCHRLTPDNLTAVENLGENCDGKDISCSAEIYDEEENNLNQARSKTLEVLHSLTINNSQISIELQTTVNNTEKETNTGDANGDMLDDHSEDIMEVLDSDSENCPENDEIRIDENVLDEVLNGVSKLTDSSFVNLIRFFEKKKIPFRQFESFVAQKCLEFLTDISERGKQRALIGALLQKELEWRTKFKHINAQQKELKAVIRMHKEDLLKNPMAKPHVITRTVGLQAILCSKKEAGCARLSKTLMPSAHQSGYDSVNVISDDDDDDIVVLQTSETDLQNSCSKSTENATPKKVRVASPPRVTIIKEVPSALPSSTDNSTTCIDLTDDTADEPTTIKHPRILNSPVKIAPRPSTITTLSQGSPPISVIKSTTQTLTKVISTKAVGYLTPNIATSTTSLLMRTSQSSEQTVTSNLNTTTRMVVSTNNRSPAGFIPINTNGHRYTLLTPLINRQLQPINVAYARPISATQLPNLAPVPPSMPIPTTHPAPLPAGVLNQRSLPSWKNLPPQPVLKAAPSGPKSNGLMLTWDMPVQKGFAEIVKYHIFAYHETSAPPSTELWKQIGVVNALPLPMACSLTQFTVGQKYHFSVRAVDVHARFGPFSKPQCVVLEH